MFKNPHPKIKITQVIAVIKIATKNQTSSIHKTKIHWTKLGQTSKTSLRQFPTETNHPSRPPTIENILGKQVMQTHAHTHTHIQHPVTVGLGLQCLSINLYPSTAPREQCTFRNNRGGRSMDSSVGTGVRCGQVEDDAPHWGHSHCELVRCGWPIF